MSRQAFESRTKAGRADTGTKFCIHRTNYQFMYLSVMEIENSTKKLGSEKKDD